MSVERCNSNERVKLPQMRGLRDELQREGATEGRTLPLSETRASQTKHSAGQSGLWAFQCVSPALQVAQEASQAGGQHT